MMKRADGRRHDQLRPLIITYDVFEYAAGSTLFQIGKTKVLSAVTLQQGVPSFLRGKKMGWLTAEYALLPASTPVRSVREASLGKRSGRTVEISRMISRVLRASVNLEGLGERTIFIDCDVQQADGGTRAACVTGAYLALKQAADRWLRDGIIDKPLLGDEVAAISVGITSEGALLDMDFLEDSIIDADFNFVLTRSGLLLELQGAAERAPITWAHFDQARALAIRGVDALFSYADVHVSSTRGFPLLKHLL